MARSRGFGVGMPATLWLDQFGSIIWDAFGDCPYLVGSVMRRKTGWRDVDVRVLLSDLDWRRWFPDLPVDSGEREWQHDAKWVAITLAFGELGKQMTGLPIDFQVQPQTYANREYPGPRSALGLVPHRWAKFRKPPGTR